MKYADLHVHTIFSDGTFTPEGVVRLAKEKGLSCISICDHDSVDGIDPAIEEGKRVGIEVIPGVELTVIKDKKEIHVLGYFVSWKETWFARILKRVQRERIARIKKMIRKLKRLNVIVKYKKVMEIAGGKGSLGRLHLAQALMASGAVSSIQMAFDKYIGDLKPCYVEDIGFSAREAVKIISKAKGIPVLAHPATIRDDALVQKLIGYGIRGIEVFHSDHASSKSKKYELMAKDYGLLVTGGSDCHGLAKRKILMGCVKIPYVLVEELKKSRPREK